jgi:hypothetical protein
MTHFGGEKMDWMLNILHLQLPNPISGIFEHWEYYTAVP